MPKLRMGVPTVKGAPVAARPVTGAVLLRGGVAVGRTAGRVCAAPSGGSRGYHECRNELQDAEAEPHVNVAEHANPHEAGCEHGDHHYEEEIPEDEQGAHWPYEDQYRPLNSPEIPASPNGLVANGTGAAGLGHRCAADVPGGVRRSRGEIGIRPPCCTAFPRLGWNRDMPCSFRRMSRYTGVYGDMGNFYGNYVLSQGPRQSQGLARRPPPLRAAGAGEFFLHPVKRVVGQH